MIHGSPSIPWIDMDRQIQIPSQPLETDRQKKVPPEERMCQICHKRWVDSDPITASGDRQVEKGVHAPPMERICQLCHKRAKLTSTIQASRHTFHGTYTEVFEPLSQVVDSYYHISFVILQLEISPKDSYAQFSCSECPWL